MQNPKINIGEIDLQGAKVLLKHYKAQIEALKAELKPYLSKFQQLEDTIGMAEQLEDVIDNAIEQSISLGTLFQKYNPTDTRIKRTVFALRKVGKLLTTRQIIDVWHKEDSNLFKTEELDLIGLQAALSATLKPKAEKGDEIQRVKGPSGDFYYGLKDWFYSNGKPKKEYNPDEVEFNYL